MNAWPSDNAPDPIDPDADDPYSDQPPDSYIAQDLPADDGSDPGDARAATDASRTPNASNTPHAPTASIAPSASDEDNDEDDDQPPAGFGVQALDEPHAFAQLTPDVVLDALATVEQYGDGRLMALSSYENRVYQASLEDGQRVVAKFYRPERWSDAQILEEHAFAAELMAAEIPAVGPLTLQGRTLHQHGPFAFSVSPWRGGRQPELDDFEVLEWIGRFLARIHTVGAAQPFAHRPALDLASFGTASRDWLPASGVIPLDMKSAWQEQCDIALNLIANRTDNTTTFGRFCLKEATQIRLHGDCHPGNILWTPLDEWGRGGPHFVDLDDARMGPAVQDLWMLLSGDRQQRTIQLSALLEGYEQFRSFDRRELALIEPLRTLRLIHYSAWLARRWHDPIFPVNFPWFGSSDYWRGQVDMLIEQIEAMQEEPLYA